MSSSAAAVLKTLAYADIFDYPLTLKELYRWLIGYKAKYTSGVYFRTPPMVENSKGFYFLQGRQSLVRLRLSRTRFSRQKFNLACKVGDWLKLFPTIQLVAVTGALAMNNSDKADDIDLMIITAPNTLWLTRPIVVIFMELLGIRRKPTSRYSLVANRFCLNLWLDTTALAVPKSNRNLYTAHEVAQVKPLWDRSNTYQHFLAANSWINSYLPNIKTKGYYPRQAHQRVVPLKVLDTLAYKFQLWYMRKRLTREKVTPHSAFFHPRDTSGQVMRQYHRQLNQLKLQP